MACNNCGDCNNCCKCPDLLNKDKRKMFSSFCAYNSEQIKPLSELFCYSDPCKLPGLLSKYVDKVACMFSNLIRLSKKQQDQIDQILDSIMSNGMVEIPRIIKTGKNNLLIDSIDLGNVTDDTRIGITWHQGSTRDTSIYTVKELKTVDAHVFTQNIDDKKSSMGMGEIFTRIHDGNKLWVTTVHYWGFDAGTGKFSALAVPWNNKNEPYYDTQDPRYVAQNTSEYYGSAGYIDYITIYDRVKPVITETDPDDDSIVGCL